jgi:hypothetical protein
VPINRTALSIGSVASDLAYPEEIAGEERRLSA